ncbi:MAG: glycosyltransferase [Anaerolineae bacterium]|nr:glycosyltransferase [Anaerolineae bacterium]
MVVHDDVIHDSRIWREARSLNAQGWRVVVVCIALGNSHLPDVQELDGFTVWRVSPRIFRSRDRVRTTRKLIQLAIALPTVFRRIRQSGAKVYHAHDFTGLVMVALAGVRQPVVYDSHELFFDRTFRGLPRWIVSLLMALRPLEKRLAHQSVAFIATSDSHADRLVQNLDMPRPVIVRNAVDLRRLGDRAAVYPFVGERRVVAHSGSLLDGRHLPELVEALRHLPDDIALVLMGQGALADKLITQAETLGVAERFAIVPPVHPDCVAPTLSQADMAVVLPTAISMSAQFSLPNKFFEAIAAGLPLVVSSIPELKRMVDTYDLGLVCDPTNPADIAEKIEALLQPETLARCRENAKRARSDINWANEEKKLIAIYQRIFEQIEA